MGNLTQQTAPTEMHLSDCAITSMGFQFLISAIEETEVYPIPDPNTPGQGTPLYLRLENNFISEVVIQEKVDAGVIKPFTKKGSKTSALEGGAKILLVVKSEGAGFDQKEGEPPAPEDAPPPKKIWDWSSEQRGNWNSKELWAQACDLWAALGGTSQYGKWNSKGGTDAGNASCKWCQKGECWTHRAVANSSPKKYQSTPYQSTPLVPKGAPMKGAGKNQSSSFQAPQSGAGMLGSKILGLMAAAKQPAIKGVLHGTAGKAADRSRTPVNRTAKQPAPPKTPPPKPPGTTIPHPWEEHFDDTYQIPFYWNTETGESCWEKPAAWG